MWLKLKQNMNKTNLNKATAVQTKTGDDNRLAFVMRCWDCLQTAEIWQQAAQDAKILDTTLRSAL